MLKKVIKYDLRDTARLFLPMYVIYALITVGLKLVLLLPVPDNSLYSIVKGTSIMAYIFASIAIVVMTLVFLVMHFYRKFISNQAYLTFTLPVRTWHLLISKYLMNGLWYFCSAVLLTGSILLVTSGTVVTDVLADLLKQLQMDSLAHELFANGFGLTVFLLMLMTLLSLFAGPAIYFASMAIGQMLGKNKILGAIAAYLLISFVMQIVTSVLTIPFTVTISFIKATIHTVNIYLAVLLLIQIVIQAAYYAVTWYFLSRKLNLE